MEAEVVVVERVVCGGRLCCSFFFGVHLKISTLTMIKKKTLANGEGRLVCVLGGSEH